MDDVMRLMYDRFAKKRAFTGADIERAASDVCKCNVHRFFENHVRGAQAIDFNPLLAPLGLRGSHERPPPTALGVVSRPPHYRVRLPTGRMGEDLDRYPVMSAYAFGMGGIRTDTDRLLPDFSVISNQTRDVVAIEVAQPGGATQQINVKVTGFETTRARVVEIPNATPAQLERRRLWLSAALPR